MKSPHNLNHKLHLSLAISWGALVSLNNLAFADEIRTASTLASWVLEDQAKALQIDVIELLTPSQKDIVHSGFSTFTIFAISDQKIIVQEKMPDLRSICSVKYDTWEERYQLIRVDPAPVINIVAKDFKSWSERCLQLKILDSSILSKLENGGTLYAILQIRQSSPDEGAKIKNWLVSQQSGFMQGLYAHMLGEFEFKGTVQIQISVPPLISTVIDAPQKTPPLKKGT